jgi:hypothetical protein
MVEDTWGERDPGPRVRPSAPGTEAVKFWEPVSDSATEDSQPDDPGTPTAHCESPRRDQGDRGQIGFGASRAAAEQQKPARRSAMAGGDDKKCADHPMMGREAEPLPNPGTGEE